MLKKILNAFRTLHFLKIFNKDDYDDISMKMKSGQELNEKRDISLAFWFITLRIFRYFFPFCALRPNEKREITKLIHPRIKANEKPVQCYLIFIKIIFLQKDVRSQFKKNVYLNMVKIFYLKTY